jgi:D-sedoheptulose 7-phosphate isomerase
VLKGAGASRTNLIIFRGERSAKRVARKIQRVAKFKQSHDLKSRTMGHAADFFAQASTIAKQLDDAKVDKLASELAELRARNGRLFVLGVGGSAGNASHSVNDFRKLCGIEAYAPCDNVSELTARANDEGWDTIFTGYLDVSRADADDALFIFSVGGGDAERNISPNIVKAVDMAKARGMKVFGVVGRDSGHTAKHGDTVIVVPVVDPALRTPHSEAFQAVVWHCLVSHPVLQKNATKW